jgi:nitroimidazol reductase NimA-like FMN-containing flavoprotein (pyridoxamine 5'-phosphate oxidase superfamily)
VQLSETPRTTITRLPERGRSDRNDLYAILDAGLVCHLGFVRDGAPVVLPTGYGRIDDTMYVHGSSGAGWTRAVDGAPVCVTVTHLDAIVYARSVFDHSMNYRSAVVHGIARRVDDADEVWAGLAAVAEQLAPGSWDYVRRPSKRELAATAVLALDLAEASVKVRTGPPSDDPQDLDSGRWAGVLPIRLGYGPAEPAPDVAADLAAPRHVSERSLS